MASDTGKVTHSIQVFDCESIPIPPGSKCRANLWRGPGADPRLLIGRLSLGMTILAALAVGILIGRFLLP